MVILQPYYKSHALKAELAVRGADVELTARRVDKMNDSYDVITGRVCYFSTMQQIHKLVENVF